MHTVLLKHTERKKAKNIYYICKDYVMTLYFMFLNPAITTTYNDFSAETA